MQANKRVLFFSVILQFSCSALILGMVASATSESAALAVSAPFDVDSPRKLRKTPPRHHRRRKYNLSNDSNLRRLIESLGTTQSSSDDDGDEQSANGTNVCSPLAECELCPHNWKVLIEKEDERIKGEYESCVKYGRRRQFECTILFQESDSSEKRAKTLSEYRPCQYTESDEQYRMLRMQMMCLLVGFWAIRNVRRQKVASASLFDQRRMRSQNGSGRHVTYAPLPIERKDSMETVELIPRTTGPGKVPKSPAPDPNVETVI